MLDFVADVVGAPFRMIDGAIRGAAEAAIPKDQKKVEKKQPKEGRKAPRQKPAPPKEGTATLAIQGRDGRVQNMMLRERLATNAQLAEMGRQWDTRMDGIDDEVDDIIADLKKNDVVTNDLVEQINRMQADDRTQGEAIQKLAAAVDELKKQTSVALPASEQGGGINPMLMMAMSSSGGGINPMAMLLMGQGGGNSALQIPVYRNPKTGAMYVDAFYSTMIMDVVAGLGIFGDKTKAAADKFAAAQKASQDGRDDDVKRLITEVSQELAVIVKKAVSDAVK